MIGSRAQVRSREASPLRAPRSNIISFVVLVSISGVLGTAVSSFVPLLWDHEGNLHSEKAWTSSDVPAYLVTKYVSFGTTRVYFFPIFPVPSPDGFDDPRSWTEYNLAQYPTKSSIVPKWTQAGLKPTESLEEHDPHSNLAEIASGWPSRSFACRFWFGDNSSKGLGSVLAIEHGLLLRESSNGQAMYSVVLPIRPIWPGILINWFFYAGVAGSLKAGWNCWRRVARRRAGLCVECGYPIAADQRCPECGSLSPANS